MLLTIEFTHSAVCSQHFVSGLLQSAFCTNRLLWHQYSLFLVTVIRKTHTIYHKILVCELIRHFRIFVLFRVNSLLSFCKNVEITYNVSSNPPTPQKITLACIACLCFFHDFNFPERLKLSGKILTFRNDSFWSVIQQYLQMFSLRLNVILSKFYGQ